MGSDDRATGTLPALLDELGLDALLVTDAPDVRYLSGFRGEDTTLVVGRTSALICTDSRFWAQVHEEVPDFELVKTERLLTDAVAAVAAQGRSAGAAGFPGRGAELRGVSPAAAAAPGPASRTCGAA